MIKAHTFRTWLLCLALVFSTGIILVSCQKESTTPFDEKDLFPDPSTLPQGLIGAWVETTTLTDTLEFITNNDFGLAFLYRGYEIRNGYYLPVIGTDGYFYTIDNDSIRMQAGLSSLWFDDTFYFSFDRKNLVIDIGKFCKYIESDENILTFRKIR